jgi:hypothetical protein
LFHWSNRCRQARHHHHSKHRKTLFWQSKHVQTSNINHRHIASYGAYQLNDGTNIFCRSDITDDQRKQKYPPWENTPQCIAPTVTDHRMVYTLFIMHQQRATGVHHHAKNCSCIALDRKSEFIPNWCKKSAFLDFPPTLNF